MFVIFRSDSKTYYSDMKNEHWVSEITLAAMFKSEESATNFSKSGLKNEYKCQLLKFVNLDTSKANDAIPVEEMNEESAAAAYEELYRAAEAFGKAARKIPSIANYYQGIQSDMDKLQEDLLHKLELAPACNILLVRLSRRLKDCRGKRRDAKDRLHYIQVIKNAFPMFLLDAHEKHNKLMEERTYTPRIDKELFDN